MGADEIPTDAERTGGARTAGAASLGLFALILLAIDVTGVHPGLPGRTGAEQIQQLAAQAERWRQVHAGFSAAGLLGLIAVLSLWRLVLPGGLKPMAHVAAAAGLVGAIVFSATVLAEVVMIPDLAEACAASPACLSGENARFTETFADVGWRVLPGLDYGARLLMAGIAALALLGWGTDRLRVLESLPLVLGAGYELVGRTGLHGWGNFRLEDGFTGISAVLVLTGAAAMMVRWPRKRSSSRSPNLDHEPPSLPRTHRG